jgi:uncharacterized phage-associated protein
MFTEKEIQKIRLGNAINYLVENTKRCYEVKLFKLLFFLDFIKFKRTGRPFFNLVYTVHKAGPVPELLFSDFKLKTSEFEEYFEIKKKKSRKPRVEEYHFVAKKPIAMGVFSKVDQDLLFEVATEFYGDRAEAMIAKTHFVSDPWAVTKRDKGMKAIIDYTTAIDGFGDSISEEEALEAMEFLKLTKVA